MKNTKKVIAVLTAAVILILSAFPTAFAAAYEEEHCENIPYIYVHGKQDLLVWHEDGTVTKPIKGLGGIDIPSLVSALAPKLLTAVVTDDWTDYSEALVEQIVPIWDDVRVNGDGYPVNPNTCVEFYWYPEYIPSEHNHRSLAKAYTYEYDYRLSPMDIADDLYAYIEAVKAQTGHSKVNLVCRCLGANYTMAYLEKYEKDRGYSDINKLFILSGTQKGIAQITGMLTGNIELEKDSVLRYITTSEDFGNITESEIWQVLTQVLKILNKTPTFENVIWLINDIYGKIKDSAMSPILRAFYGSIGGTLCNIQENFEEAIDYLYPTDELKAEYSGVIEKARYYYNNVYLKMDDILIEMDSLGVPTYNITEYGYQQSPLYGEKSTYIGDATVGLIEQSNGAVCSKVDGTLSESYINERVALGYEKYISADKQIDASTCLFPDRTWFIKNINHHFPSSLEAMVDYLAYAPNGDINSSPLYPQFMNAVKTGDSSWELEALNQTNKEDIDWDSIENPKKDDIIRFFIKLVGRLLKEIILKIKQAF